MPKSRKEKRSVDTKEDLRAGDAQTEQDNAGATTPHSEIIEQCTIYAQATAAYDGGFRTDPTGDFDYAGGAIGGAHMKKATRALGKLTAHSKEKRLLSAAECLAEANVMKLLMKASHHTALEHWELNFIEHFAKDVRRYFKHALSK